MLRKIELVSDEKLDSKTMNKIKGGSCTCARCICGRGSVDTWSSENSQIEG